jgi:hypothetical protein
MKRTVIVFGIISGLIVSGLMVFNTIGCYNNPNMDHSMWLGYLSMIIAFAFIFVGIKSYRDKQNNGSVTFGKAFLIGLYIALIGSTFYVVTWLFEYYLYMPDFMEKYTMYALKDAREHGASAKELAEKTAEMAKYTEMYKSPVFVVLFTYLEILPVGLLVALISALILKRKSQNPDVAIAN